MIGPAARDGGARALALRRAPARLSDASDSDERRVAQGAGYSMTATKPTLRLALLFLFALAGCKIVSNKQLAALDAKSSSAFDPAAYVEKVWTPKAVADFKANAVDLATLLPAIEADPEKAGKTYGRGGGEGNPWSYEVKGEGKVVAVDVKSRHGLMTVDIAAKGGARQVDLQIGPVIFGTALRDSLPFIHFGDFVNQIQFAQIARALNDQATNHLMKSVDPGDIVGKSVVFYGAATAGSASAKMSVTPISIGIAKEAPP